MPNLKGAVSDADSVQDFLRSFLRIPSHRIKNLRNEEATRVAIEDEIKNLASSTAISKDDPILIYFAGHGTQANAPSGWPTGNAEGIIQMLVPHDFAANGSDDIRRGQGFLDVTFSSLLADLASQKSDNIVSCECYLHFLKSNIVCALKTIILDSCHSGSGTRKDRLDPDVAVRGFDLPESYVVPQALLTEYSAARASAIAKGFEKTGLRSHILLAACMQHQEAMESHGKGMFTSQLITLFKEEGVDKLTYQDVITMLPPLRW